VLADTFRILNVTLEEKNQLLDFLKQAMEERITGQLIGKKLAGLN